MYRKSKESGKLNILMILETLELYFTHAIPLMVAVETDSRIKGNIENNGK